MAGIGLVLRYAVEEYLPVGQSFPSIELTRQDTELLVRGSKVGRSVAGPDFQL